MTWLALSLLIASSAVVAVAAIRITHDDLNALLNEALPLPQEGYQDEN